MANVDFVQVKGGFNMVQFSKSVVINRSIEEVFDYSVDPTNTTMMRATNSDLGWNK